MLQISKNEPVLNYHVFEQYFVDHLQWSYLFYVRFHIFCHLQFKRRQDQIFSIL